jgi:hypothetical protein
MSEKKFIELSSQSKEIISKIQPYFNDQETVIFNETLDILTASNTLAFNFFAVLLTFNSRG